MTHVRIQLYNQLGVRVTTLIDAYEANGEHRLVLDSREFESGLYTYVFEAGNTRTSHRLLIVK
jgi:hypothetical protein